MIIKNWYARFRLQKFTLGSNELTATEHEESAMPQVTWTEKEKQPLNGFNLREKSLPNHSDAPDCNNFFPTQSVNQYESKEIL
jgi:hypothetical protein